MISSIYLKQNKEGTQGEGGQETGSRGPVALGGRNSSGAQEPRVSRKHLPGQAGREEAGSLQGGVDLPSACSFLLTSWAGLDESRV